MAAPKVIDLSTEKFIRDMTEINPKYDDSVIIKAYEIARRLHDGQFRKSGEPYIIHPVAVAKILAQFGMDNETVIAGLLHDSIEDTGYTRDQLAQDFDDKIADLVEGVTKLTNISYDSSEAAQAENFRKMFLAMSKDIRVLIVKLADRLHNMRTLEYMPTEKRITKAMETLEIYAPLAGRLGIFSIKFELEDLALKYLHPLEYKKLVAAVDRRKSEYARNLKVLTGTISNILDEAGIQHDVKGRSKHLYSIYRKMIVQQKQIDEIFDILAVRILVSSVKDCYAALGLVHNRWKPIPGRFKDYIAMPKPNMYQSIHTTVLGDNGEPFEIQIRTYEMHRIAEYGIAAHWKYKEGKVSGTVDDSEQKLAWLRQALEWQKEADDSVEFLISANPGEPPKPIGKIASGGELSRIMLAIKTVLADIYEIDTMIFDEVDTGISGRAAHKVGVKLHEVSRMRQIICITHLAQMAAQADTHLLIQKNVSDGRTFTSVTPLDFQQRKQELARINGGDTITDTMLQTAEELLNNAGFFS